MKKVIIHKDNYEKIMRVAGKLKYPVRIDHVPYNFDAEVAANMPDDMYVMWYHNGSYGEAIDHLRSHYMRNYMMLEIEPLITANVKLLGDTVILDGARFYNSYHDDFSFKDMDIDFTRCDGCGKAIKRNDIYIIEEDGVRQQLGGTCWRNKDSLYKLSGFYINLFRQIGGYVEEDHRLKIDFMGLYLHNTPLIVGLIMSHGFVSKKVSAEQGIPSTVDRYRELTESEKVDQDMVDRIIDSGADWTGKLNMIPILEELREGGSWDFYTNLITSVDKQNHKTLGFYVYAVYACLKKLGAFIKPGDGKALDLPVGKTRDIPGVWKVLKKEVWEGDYGPRATLYLQDKDLNQVMFSVDPSKVEGLEGDIKLRAGIKGINRAGTYLILTRVKIM